MFIMEGENMNYLNAFCENESVSSENEGILFINQSSSQQFSNYREWQDWGDKHDPWYEWNKWEKWDKCDKWDAWQHYL